MCVVGSFMWQYVLLVLLGGNVFCWVIYVAMCIVVYLRWQVELLVLLGGNV